MRNEMKKILSLTIFSFLFFSCHDFLDKKPDMKLSEPISLEDFHALMNEQSLIQTAPSEGEISAGDLYLTVETLESLNCETEWDLYLWRDGPMTQMCYGTDGWRQSYQAIYNYNTVIEGLKKYQGVRNSTYYDLTGEAYFLRGITYLELAVIFGEAYDQSQAAQQLGLPLRLSTDFNEKSIRSNLSNTYSNIISDLQIASHNLPTLSKSKMRPTKAAALGALARAYLFMGDFENAKLYADSCLISRDLMDYKDFDIESDYPFSRLDNEEIIFERYLLQYMSLYPEGYANVDPLLYSMYEDNDIRKKLYFKESNGLYTFKGSYGGSFSNFAGIAVDEIYLILLESSFELGEINQAKLLLKNFMNKRYYDASIEYFSDHQIYERILYERRKQLLFRGTRFADIKRLNKKGANISLKRVIRDEVFTLPPNDPRFTILLPLDIIQLSGMEQNKR